LAPILGTVPLAKLETLHVEGLYGDMERQGATAWTRRAAGVVLSIALRHAVTKLKLLRNNPAADVAKPRPAEKEVQFLTEVQVKRFLRFARGTRLYPLFALAVGSGARQGELLGLAWGDVDFDKGTIVVRRSLAQLGGEFVLKEPKSKTSRRTIALPRFALDALGEHRAAMLKEGNIGAPVFCTRAGTYIGKSNLIRQVFKPVLTRANAAAVDESEKTKTDPVLLPPIRFHDLRHSHATGLLAKGHSIKAVSQRLGHATIDITLSVYAHVLPTDDAALAEGLNRMYG
jgi:integrase